MVDAEKMKNGKSGKVREINKELSAVARGLSLAISPKAAVEVANAVRGMSSVKAKKLLEDVIAKKRAIPLRRFCDSRGHRKNIGPGFYPVSVAGELLKLIKGAEANASFKGLNTSLLVVRKIMPNTGSESYHYSRRRGLKTKCANIEVVLEEIAKPDDKKMDKKKRSDNKKEKAVGDGVK